MLFQEKIRRAGKGQVLAGPASSRGATSGLWRNTELPLSTQLATVGPKTSQQNTETSAASTASCGLTLGGNCLGRALADRKQFQVVVLAASVLPTAQRAFIDALEMLAQMGAAAARLSSLSMPHRKHGVKTRVAFLPAADL
jgi:hypothetical protein